MTLSTSIRSKFFGLVLVSATLISSGNAYAWQGPQPSPAPSAQPTDHAGQIQDDKQLLAAFQSHHNQFYVEAGNLVVTKILPEDHQGLPHQKWEARMSNGQTVQVVYNLDMGDHIPLQVGDKFGVGGQFIWTGNSGLVHWVHSDPSGKRPDGYVYYNGTAYGDSDNPVNKH